MNKGMLFTVLALAASLGMVTTAGADSSDWVYFTNAADIGMGPGADLLMGTADDAADANNLWGAYSNATIVWDPGDPTCPPPSVGFLRGNQTTCNGDPTGQFSLTYLDAQQTELPGTGTGGSTLKLTPGTVSAAGPCGIGAYSGTSSFTITYDGGIPIPLAAAPFNGRNFDATTPYVGGTYDCGPGLITYSQAYIESVRQKLPGTATYFTIVCARVNFGPSPIPCLNDSISQGTSILWTDDPITCDGVCCDNDGDDVDGTQCAGTDCIDTNPAAYPGAPEVNCNGIDEDCDGSDSCSGSCAGGPAG